MYAFYQVVTIDVNLESHDENKNLCDKVTLIGEGGVATKYAKYLGTFIRTDKWHKEMPVFRNASNNYLYCSGKYWSVGREAGGAGSINSYTTPNCPASVEKWYEGFISVTCSTHSH